MWQLFNVNDREPFDWCIGAAHARIVRDGAHWEVCFSCPPSKDVRYDIIGTGEMVCFKPFLPANPLIAFLPQKTALAPESEICFKTVLPAVLEIEIGRYTKLPLQPFPLKMSFEGTDTINGELCAVLPEVPQLLYAGEIEDGRAGMSLAEAEAAGPSLLIFSETIIRNRSKQVYEFDRIVIYPETVNIYGKNGNLVADLVIIDYVDGAFHLQTPSAAPKEYQLLTAGQKDGVGARIFRQSAGFFKDITSIKLT
ncbi:MAG: hypothetical protein LBT00_13960 [Spirochaetaceae bacterium]|jgi:hypothetical protein|nr:hypothetical protein [Spirochaetaceae bacterium]